MAATPLISVIVPCHNHARFLREAIDSVGATSRPVEIVIVNDGSTDDSAEVADGYARRHSTGGAVRVIHQPRAGVAAARNRGFGESRGKFVVFLDSDDRLAPNALDLGARALEDHPDAVFVYGRCQMMGGDGTLLPTPQQPRIHWHAYQELLRNNYIWTPANVMFRRGPLERYGTFDPALSGSADYELYLRLARIYPIHDHGRLVAHYRRHGANIRSDAARMLRETLAVLRSQRPYVDGDPEAMAAYRDGWRNRQEFYGSRLVNEIRDHAHAGEWGPALQKAMVLGLFYPRGLAHHTRVRLRRARALGAPG
jgi:glycosyltransferase involved in cell wall biosynthesis